MSRLTCKYDRDNAFDRESNIEADDCLLADKIEIYKMMVSKKIYTIDGFEFFYEDFGKTLFLTKEEAEKALKEMESAK